MARRFAQLGAKRAPLGFAPWQTLLSRKKAI
jgi:hypothetical protein